MRAPIFLLLAACGRQTAAPTVPDAGLASLKAAAAPPDAAVSASVQREVHITTPGGATAHVKVKAPASWSVSAYGVVLRNQFGEGVAGVEFMPTCDGDCTKAATNLEARVAGAPEAAARPNINTGDPKLDAVRLDVATLEKGDLPGGKFVVMRVTKPNGLDGPYREQVMAVCARLVPTKDRFIAATAWAPVSEEKTLAPPAIEACKTFEILP